MMQDSYSRAIAVDISLTDHTFATGSCDAIYVGGAGNIVLVPKNGGASVTFTAVPVGSILRVAAARVVRTNTTATLMIALFE